MDENNDVYIGAPPICWPSSGVGVLHAPLVCNGVAGHAVRARIQRNGVVCRSGNVPIPWNVRNEPACGFGANIRDHESLQSDKRVPASNDEGTEGTVPLSGTDPHRSIPTRSIDPHLLYRNTGLHPNRWNWWINDPLWDNDVQTLNATRRGTTYQKGLYGKRTSRSIKSGFLVFTVINRERCDRSR